MVLNVSLALSRRFEKKKEDRLGAKGHEEVLNHKWFADIDLAELEKGKLPSRYAPASEILISTEKSGECFSMEPTAEERHVVDKR